MTPSNDVHTIVVLRALQLGDTLCAIPALTLLRAQHPAARISLLALPWADELLPRYADLIDEVVPFPGFPGIPEASVDTAALSTLLRTSRRAPADLAVQLQGSGAISNPFIALLGARQAIGSYLPGEWRPGPGFIPYRHDLPEAQRLTAVVRQGSGLDQPDPTLTFPIHAADLEELSAALPDAHSRPYVCVHPGARDARRRWDLRRFAAVADQLVARGYRVLVTGVAADARLHAAMLDAMACPAESLAGDLHLGAFAALLAGARLVVTNDTGASHLAAAVGAPSVVIFTGSDPARWAPADSVRHRVVGRMRRSGPHHCCLHESCSELTATHDDVPVSEVLAAIDAHLGQVANAAAASARIMADARLATPARVVSDAA